MTSALGVICDPPGPPAPVVATGVAPAAHASARRPLLGLLLNPDGQFDALAAWPLAGVGGGMVWSSLPGPFGAMAALDRGGFDLVVVGDDERSRALRRQIRAERPDLPVLCVAPLAAQDDPFVVRERVCADGALTCVLETELSPLLLDFAIRHTLEVARLTRLVALDRPSTRQRDPLTGLATRGVFLRALKLAMQQMQSDPAAGYSVLFLDIQRFCELNATLGEPTCDSLLRAMAERVSACVTDGDLVARFGGDHFTVLMPWREGSEPDMQVADRIRWALREPFSVGTHPIYLTVSAGLVRGGLESQRPEDLIVDARSASKHARTNRNGTLLFRKTLRDVATEEVLLEMALRQAIEREELHLAYQPVVSLADGGLRGFEALLRWDRGERGRVAPLDFIPIAERTGLIVPIGRWVAEQAISQLANWRKAHALPSLFVSVNMSAHQSGDGTLVESIARALRRHDVPASCLKVELTESALVETPELHHQLRELKALGASLWVDDFGTGYSSLAQLQRFVVDGIKLDKTFVDRLDGTPTSGMMVRNIIALARDFGLCVVAEGIEQPAQRQQLAELGCDCGQGYLFAAPLAVADAVHYLGAQAPTC